MNRKIIVIFISMLLMSTILPVSATVMIVMTSKPISFDGNILYVGGSESGNYTKIQDAIDNASDGDTVFVYNGTYVENVVVDKSIQLIGENKNNTIIDGNYKDNVTKLIADGA